jgi:hypothetical protein
MLIAGSILALASGMMMALAAALEKREGMRTALSRKGFSLLAALSRRPIWVAGVLASALGWVLEAAALTLSPVPVVATLRNAGRGVLVPFGGRWLEERFSAAELAGVVLTAVGGTVTALGSAGSSIVRKPLSNFTLLEVAAGCALLAALVAGLSRWLAPDVVPGAETTGGERRRSRAAGIAAGAAVGLLFAGTGVYTKEIGDRIALYGLGGLGASFASASPYLMVASTVWAQSILQQAFRRANAASVASANATVASTGLIAAGFALYGEHVSGGFGAVALAGGIFVATIGTIMLAASRPVLPAAATIAVKDTSAEHQQRHDGPVGGEDGPVADGASPALREQLAGGASAPLPPPSLHQRSRRPSS